MRRSARSVPVLFVLLLAAPGCGSGGDAGGDAAADGAVGDPDAGAPAIPAGRACAEEACTPAPLATSPYQPRFILADDTSVYWLGREENPPSGIQEDFVYATALAGGEVREYAAGADQLREAIQFLEDEQSLYLFSTACCMAGLDHSVYRKRKGVLGSWRPVVDLGSLDNDITAVTLDGERLYFSAGGSASSRLQSVALATGEDWREHAADLDRGTVHLLNDAAEVYLIGADAAGSYGVLAVAKADASVRTVATFDPADRTDDSQDLGAGAVQDATHLYVTYGRTLLKVAKAGGYVPLLRDVAPWERLAIDAEYVYWTDYGDAGDGRVLAVAKAGGAATVLASGQAGPADIAAGGGAVYWVNFEDNRVMRLRAGQ